LTKIREGAQPSLLNAEKGEPGSYRWRLSKRPLIEKKEKGEGAEEPLGILTNLKVKTASFEKKWRQETEKSSAVNGTGREAGGGGG
jgi:hypothetical protein